jgi:hypothetical protein
VVTIKTNGDNTQTATLYVDPDPLAGYLLPTLAVPIGLPQVTPPCRTAITSQGLTRSSFMYFP